MPIFLNHLKNVNLTTKALLFLIFYFLTIKSLPPKRPASKVLRRTKLLDSFPKKCKRFLPFPRHDVFLLFFSLEFCRSSLFGCMLCLFGDIDVYI